MEAALPSVAHTRMPVAPAGSFRHSSLLHRDSAARMGFPAREAAQVGVHRDSGDSGTDFPVSRKGFEAFHTLNMDPAPRVFDPVLDSRTLLFCLSTQTYCSVRDFSIT